VSFSFLSRGWGDWADESRTGYEQHGDYLFGWKGDALQQAMDARCNLDTCSKTPGQAASVSEKCVKTSTVNEPVDECEYSRRIRSRHGN
jgi:hypothetical protein